MYMHVTARTAWHAHLSGGKDDFVLVKDIDGCRLCGHVGALQHILHSSLHQSVGILLINLILGGTGHGNVVLGTLHLPGLLTLKELACMQELLLHASVQQRRAKSLPWVLESWTVSKRLVNMCWL